MRPLGVRSKAVKHNNLSLLRYFGNPNETLLPFLGSYLPTVDRESEDMAAKVRYLWQDTLEELAEKKEITLDTLTRAWVLVSTPNKPDIPDAIKKLFAVEPPKNTPKEVKPDYDQFLDDVDMTLIPAQAKQEAEAPEADLDMEHDTFDTFEDVFKSWPYVKTADHALYGKILIVGQLSGRNRQDQLVYKGCKLDDDSFGKIPAIAEYERKGARDATYKIRILKLKKASVLKFWVNIDDPNRPKGQRDIEELYRYFEVSPNGLKEVDSLAYQGLKNQLTLN